MVEDFFTRSICVKDSSEAFASLESLSLTKLKFMLGMMCCYSQGCIQDEQKEFEGDSDAIFCAVFI